ncbi:NAD(P)-dependent alcohol dehydrogenase [Azohydromonas lata]|uniref:NAD(P)-dependent alcohol dehydrogenase n=1 Tax=Azohydromonas lata TaxID=45677 RepID=A0ABU5IQG3_9BURK|nr:NAD(P)-dependent alcohol dehydrogenase [Azohydromonas lata]MDZ5461128.1 NAD(P)-dependent alcohol dehydrogenase [Azohydromonas lata]
MIQTQGYAAKDASSRLEPFTFEREEPAADEVQIEVLYCGICHSDIHQVKNEWGNSVYPCVPGHEVVGRVTRVGERVTRHAVGDLVGVGCMIDSCRHCAPCRLGEQNYCEGPNSWLATYNGPMVPKAKAPDKKNRYGRDNTFGGYADSLVVKEDFVLKVPASLKPEVAAPILCAGVTTWSPLRHWKVQPGQHVGVIGFGGLGDMAVKLARALGAQVTVFTRTEDKLQDAQRLGAQGVLEGDEAALKQLERSLDFMLSTVPEKHDLNPFIPLLKRNGALVVVGALEPMASVNNQEVAFHRRSVAGSLIGSIEETQEVLDFCAEHDIGPDVQLVRIQDVNEAFDSVERGEARFRYVIDMASLKGEAAAAP